MVVNEETGSSRRRDRGCRKVVCAVLTLTPLVGEAFSHCPARPRLLIVWSFSLEWCIFQGAYFCVFIIALVFEGSSTYLCFCHLPWIVSFTFHLPPEQVFASGAAAPTHCLCWGMGKGVGELGWRRGGALVPWWPHMAPGPLAGSFSICRWYSSLQPFCMLAQN